MSLTQALRQTCCGTRFHPLLLALAPDTPIHWARRRSEDSRSGWVTRGAVGCDRGRGTLALRHQAGCGMACPWCGGGQHGHGAFLCRQSGSGSVNGIRLCGIRLCRRPRMGRRTSRPSTRHGCTPRPYCCDVDPDGERFFPGRVVHPHPTRWPRARRLASPHLPPRACSAAADRCSHLLAIARPVTYGIGAESPRDTAEKNVLYCSSSCLPGRSTVNRGHEHHRTMRRCSAREGRPRRFGGPQRDCGTCNDRSSRTVPP